MAKLLSGTRIYGTATVDTTLFVDGTDDASSATTGAVQVVGGVGIGGTLYVEGTTVFAGDLAVNSGNITTTATTFNLINTNATTVNFAGDATTIEIGAASGTTNINNNLDVDGDVNISGGDLIVSTATFNLANTTATTVNFAGAATVIEIGSASGITNINNNLDVDGDVNIDGGDLTVSTVTFNLANTTATTVNFAGAATTLELGAATGITSVNNNLDVDGDVNIDGGDLTTSLSTFNLLNTTATTINAFGDSNVVKVGSAASTVTLDGTTESNNIGTGSLVVKGGAGIEKNLNVGGNSVLTGTLVVNGGSISSAVFNSTSTQLLAPTIGDYTGERVRLYDFNNLAKTNYAIGVESSAIWFGVDTNLEGQGFKWYGSTTQVMRLSAAGNLTLVGNATLDGDIEVNGGDITTTATTFNLLNATATTVNFAGAATDVQIGAATGTTNVNNNLDVDGDVNIDGDLNVVKDVNIDGGDLTSSLMTFNLLNTNTSTVNAFGDAIMVNIGAAGFGGTLTIRNDNVLLVGDLSVNGGDIVTDQASFNLVNTTATTVNFAGTATDVQIGAATGTTNVNNNLDVDLDLNVDGGAITTNQTTFNLLNATATTVNAFSAATSVNIGAATGITTVNNNLVVTGDLTVNGNTTVLNTSTLDVEDINITVAKGAVDATAANGAGLTVDGANATITYLSVGDKWAFNKSIDVTGAADISGNVSVGGTLTITGDTTFTGDIAVNGGDITTNQTTFNLLNSIVTTGNLFGEGTAITIGATTGTTTIRNANTVVTGDLAVNGGDITTTSTGTATLFNTNATSLNIGGAATDIQIGSATGTTSINNDLSVSGNLTPTVNNIYDLGINDNKWKAVYATKFVGEIYGGTY